MEGEKAEVVSVHVLISQVDAICRRRPDDSALLARQTFPRGLAASGQITLKSEIFFSWFQTPGLAGLGYDFSSLGSKRTLSK